MNPTVIDLKTYVPALDFEESRRFYAELGFELTEAWGGSYDCRLGGAEFRLQNYYIKDWAENFMMRLLVADARVWYDHVNASSTAAASKTSASPNPKSSATPPSSTSSTPAASCSFSSNNFAFWPYRAFRG